MAATAEAPNDALLRMSDIAGRKVRLSESRIFELVRAKRFPQPAKLDGCTLWSEREINQWIAATLSTRAAAAQEVAYAASAVSSHQGSVAPSSQSKSGRRVAPARPTSQQRRKQ